MEVFQEALWLLFALAACHVARMAVENSGGMLLSLNQCWLCRTHWLCACNSVCAALPSVSAQARSDSVNYTKMEACRASGSALTPGTIMVLTTRCSDEASMKHEEEGPSTAGCHTESSMQAGCAFGQWAKDQQFPGQVPAVVYPPALPCFSLTSTP